MAAKVIDKDTDAEIHKGRREKLRNSFARYGLETFNETQVLEYALGLAIPRIDTNPTAHRLINTFGSLEGVISANPDKLQKVPGMGTAAAHFIHFLKQFITYMMSLERQSKKVTSTADALELLRGIMQTYPVEHFIVVCLDAEGKMLLHQNICGDIEKVDIDIRDIADTALRVTSRSILFSHNHVNGNVHPSTADIRLTRALVGVLAPLGINITDHIIFAGDKYYSFMQSGVLDILKREHHEYFNSNNFPK